MKVRIYIKEELPVLDNAGRVYFFPNISSYDLGADIRNIAGDNSRDIVVIDVCGDLLYLTEILRGFDF